MTGSGNPTSYVTILVRLERIVKSVWRRG